MIQSQRIDQDKSFDFSLFIQCQSYLLTSCHIYIGPYNYLDLCDLCIDILNPYALQAMYVTMSKSLFW